MTTYSVIIDNVEVWSTTTETYEGDQVFGEYYQRPLSGAVHLLIDGVTIGATTPVAGTFDVLTVNTALQATGGSIDNIMVGSTTPSTGAFTSLEASELTADLINMAGHIIPTVDVTRELGSNAKKWAKLYVDVINANSINFCVYGS